MPKPRKPRTQIAFPDKLIISRRGKDEDVWYEASTVGQLHDLKDGEDVMIYTPTKAGKIRNKTTVELE